MAFIDALLRVCSAQAFTAVAVSASSIDLKDRTPKREIATGEQMGFLLSVIVAASSTTVLVEIIQATDDVLTAGIIVLDQRTFLSADMPIGRQIFMALPEHPTVAGPLRYLGLRVTPAGGAATVTLTADFTAKKLTAPQPQQTYADNFTP